MVLVDGKPINYALRWRFSYSDGKADRVGVWGSPGTRENHACYMSKENLAFVYLEGRCIRTHKVRIFYEVRGENFENFQWLGSVIIRPNPGVNRQKLAPTIRGARIVSRNFIHSVDIRGYTSQVVRSEEDKKTIFHGTGK